MPFYDKKSLENREPVESGADRSLEVYQIAFKILNYYIITSKFNSHKREIKSIRGIYGRMFIKIA